MKLILFYSFLCCRAIKYKQRIFTQRDGTLFQNTEVDFYFYPTADILHFVFEVYKAFHKIFRFGWLNAHKHTSARSLQTDRLGAVKEGGVGQGGLGGAVVFR